MFVRTAGERDLGAIRTLLVETWHATYDAIYGAGRINEVIDIWYSPAKLKASLERPNAEFLVADDSKRIGGVAHAESAEGGAVVDLHQLLVAPDLQGRGIGGMLLDEVIESFPEARAIRLQVAEQNRRAVAFYLGNGFVQIGRTDNHGSGQSGIAELILERSLSAER
ncbi:MULTISPECIES: GNAT family N-acetyltransferase [unclassified Mesorhizobium]|uniref:GNAT family N-acetyltransferase n=1 Tax=unclassified Mesorhizobium TaxID=325217 RepID=UPI00112A4515|nr:MULTISPECIES: GNAT family N-acetyltransferase [unclassified Mesorhizobium]TPK82636.1 GNAT family N-acetyltransferase [Mesorhizobium sp. B2-4-17]UCI33717.1 GNAT family N-acetyltransferase [Mesorhizobium sp. B4-1-4]